MRAFVAKIALGLRRFRIRRQIQGLGFKRRFISHEGYRLHAYERRLGKPLVVLLHGFLDSSHTWRRLIARLKDDFDLFLLDLPGFGESTYPSVRELWHVDAKGRSIGRFLQNQFAGEDYSILTHSLGGLVALHACEYLLAHNHKALPEHLHLIAPGLFKLPARDRDKIRRRLFPESTQEVQELLTELYAVPPAVPEWLLEGVRAESARAEFFDLAENTIEREDIVFFTLKRIKAIATNACPVTLYWGDRDKITGLEQGRKAARAHRNVTLVVFNGAGHALHIENTDMLADKLVSTLAR